MGIGARAIGRGLPHPAGAATLHVRRLFQRVQGAETKITVTELPDDNSIQSTFSDAWKRFFLGKPLINENLEHESLSNVVALGALSPDAISSTVYGPEQIMVELLPAAGLAAFVLVIPIAGIILLILALVTASYRQVVMAYTQRGGSYVVARANFGPRIAQISSAALLIDYVVTVAVQCASGTFAVVSAVPAWAPTTWKSPLGRCC